MKIGILYGALNTPKSDMRRPEYGNPGVGGTEYCVGMLIRYLSTYPEFTLTVYQYKRTIFPEAVNVKNITSFEEVLYYAEKEDVFICTNRLDSNDYYKMAQYKANIVLWVHNHLLAAEASVVADCDSIKRVVFVGRQLYDLYIDHKICCKSTYIFNMFKGDLEEYNRQKDYKRIVTYIGRLDHSKGFHLLAKQWRNILEKVPDAQLYVIGNGKLYSSDFVLGQYGLAEEKYEKCFMPYLTYEDGKILDSVHFCGILGQEKYQIFNQTAVGVVNPSALTETFCLSAVEMEACGIPIVTKAAQGLLDTVKHMRTGLLYSREKDLEKNIVTLLIDQKMNNKLGKQAKEFVCTEFEPERVVESWKKLLQDVCQNKKAEYLPPQNFYFKQNKWIRLLNRKLQKLTGKQISVMEWKARLYRNHG